jgi:hypothetical protein
MQVNPKRFTVFNQIPSQAQHFSACFRVLPNGFDLGGLRP